MRSDISDDAERSADELEIRALQKRMLEAWGAGDGTAFAAPFSDNALFVAFDGSVLRGRARIAAVHQELFERWLKGTHLVEERTDIRFLGPDVAVVHSVGGTVMRGKSEPAPERDSIQTLVAVTHGGAWTFVSFQNTRIRPVGAGSLSALLWLIADRLWGLLFRLSKTTPRKAAGSGEAASGPGR